MSAVEKPKRDRQIRVFISSTFRDMQAERDYLVKFIFPQLRKLCESRGVTWGEVDLRWGVTDEQAAEGKVDEFVLHIGVNPPILRKEPAPLFRGQGLGSSMFSRAKGHAGECRSGR